MKKKFKVRNIRVFLNLNFALNDSISLTKEISHYLLNVMRCENGDEIKVFNGVQGEWKASVEYYGKEVVLQSLEKLKDQYIEPYLKLAFAPTKNVQASFIIQKATELGVSHIQPVMTERTIVRDVHKKRLEKIAIEAAEQSERLTIPTITQIISLEEFIAQVIDHTVIFCDESGKGIPVEQALNDKKIAKPVLLIGPEGGFSKAERDKIKKLHNVTSIGLGGRILKSDTAVISALSCYQALCGDWKMLTNFQSTK